MTTVLGLARSLRRTRVDGILRWAALVFLATGHAASAQNRPVHWLNAGAMPPGAIGSQRLERGGPLSGYFQPVLIRAPQGARIALAMEAGFSEPQANEALVGMQIGPVYRLKLTGIPNNDGVEVFPTLEIIDRLYPPPGLSMKFPLPIELTQDELEQAGRGAFITRVIYVEDPQHTLPIARKANEEQVWLEAPAGEDPLVTADRSGRPAAILRIGSRVPTASSAPDAFGYGSPPFVMFDPALHTKCVGKCACDTCGCESGPCGCTTDPYGPVIGPGDEYLCDGGDYVTPAGVRKDRTVVGLEPEDAISHYKTADGRTLVTPSNRVCLYAPRFAAIRRVVQVAENEQPVFVNVALEQTSPAKAALALPPIAAKQRHAIAIDLGQRPPSLFRQRQQAGGLENLQATMDAFNSLGAYANLQIIRTGEISNAEKARVEKAAQAAITLTGKQAPQVLFGLQMAQAEVGVRQAGVTYQTEGPNNPRLRLIKLASCGNALPGEEIEFTLRFDNVGDQTIDNVTVVDSLTTRFEYIPGTAKSSVGAEFITETNEAGSLVLQWDIKKPVKPGDGGILRFKVKVR